MSTRTCVCAYANYLQKLPTCPACILQTLNRIVFQLCTSHIPNTLIYAESLARTNDIMQCNILSHTMRSAFCVICNYLPCNTVCGIVQGNCSKANLSPYTSLTRISSMRLPLIALSRMRLSPSVFVCSSICSLFSFSCSRVCHCSLTELFWAINTMFDIRISSPCSYIVCCTISTKHQYLISVCCASG